MTKTASAKSVTEKNVLSEKCKSKSTVQGSFHQGDYRYLSVTGVQCVANSLISTLYSKVKPLTTWNQYDMDNILYQGQELYVHICESQFNNVSET